MAPLIAIVGCDGTGKSTLAADVAEILGRERPVAVCYLGLGSGAIGERIKHWPLVGRSIERMLARKGRQTRTAGERIPGLGTASVVYALSVLRGRRFGKMLALRSRGVTVITDRYPQIDVPGFYDGPGLSAASPGSPAVAALAARERAMYERMASYHPTLVIRLDIDAETAHARKPNHDLNLLRRKVAATAQLAFGGAPIVDLDSRAPYAQVRQRALDAIRHAIG